MEYFRSLVKNNFIIPGTSVRSYNENSLSPYLIKIPKKPKANFPMSNFIPCLHYKTSSNYLILYFHGNSEDLGVISELLVEMQKTLPYDILAIEYPKYGIYQEESSHEQMLEDSETVFKYIESKFPSKKVIIFGRSIGTGPAIHLATRVNSEALILISAFKSIKSVMADGCGGFILKHFANPLFENSELIRKVECPILFLHGKLDRLVPPKNSEDMFESVRNRNKLSMLVIRPFMDHNQFHVENDITGPINFFLKGILVTNELINVDLLGLNMPKI